MYYKVIQNNYVVDAGSAFAKWNAKHQQLFACEAAEAQVVISDTDKVYHPSWLKAAPVVIGEDAEVVIIEKDEYDELSEKLGGEIPVEEYHEEVSEAESEPMPAPEVFSVAEMRQMIIDQQKQIEALQNQVKAILNED